MAWWLFLVICCLISHQCPPYTHHLIINYVLCDLFLLSHWYRSHTDHLIMMSWIPKSRPASTSPHKKGAPLHLKANLLLFLFCFLLLQFSLFFFSFHLIELLNEKIESRKFQIVLQPKLVISIFYLVSVFVLMISILIVSVIRDFTNFSFTWLRFSMRKEILTSLRWFLGIPPMSIRQRENLSITQTVSPTQFSLYFTFIVLHVR